MMIKTWICAAMTAVALVGTAQADDAALKAAIAGTHRAAANSARDAWRHPYETLTFFGIKPDQTVVELAPGGGWYTEILAPYLRDKGTLILGAGVVPTAPANALAGVERLKTRLAAKPELYDKTRIGTFDVARGDTSLAPAGSVDLVLTFRNIHNWMAMGDDKVALVFKGAFDALKKGGVFGVVEHRLPAGKAQDDKAPSGYMSTAYVIKAAESVGFKLAASSEINANPKDKADHEGGVWALPPTFTNKDKDREKYAAVGESDRMTLKFVKP
ncbi:methyltransferase [Pelomonas sp. V22]|uniref:class I SAM-dependent methyltransferase n=1 Tax=Pelomonas sp. V22 TaxID=2822139 RepID=UPI0032C10AA7